MIKKLRFKFVLINMSIVTIMLCVILGLVFYFTSANLEQESLRMMQDIAQQPFQLGVPGELDENVRLPFFTLQLNPRGELVSTGGGYYDLSDSAFLNDLIRDVFSSPKSFGVLTKYNLRYYRVDTPLRPCVVFADISSERTTLDHLLQTCLIIGGLGFLLFLWGSIVLSRWAVKPVEQAWKQQQQFVADASHELKTPLTVIMTNAELLQNSEYNPEKKEKFVQGILTMSGQMKNLIEQMLELVRVDGTSQEKVKAAVDWSQLAEYEAMTFEPVFFEKGLTLRTQIEKDVCVLGDENQLRQILEILLDNASKYSKEKGTTWVTLHKRGKNHCLLNVSNEGQPLLDGELEKIFRRFYRADQARTRTGSFGLGLSIAESIVKQHRGKIWAQSQKGINSFFVLFPCS
ncbi:sensor histidine kinase [uncultured Ruthenibacterium sp.]|uniref:sensor histidine kinase n=1 Tax=uncultured Ruthenibacterium sp. TaxID=1905347 RepID=UPI00349EC286